MIPLHPLFKKAYWGLAGAGALYAVFMLGLTNLTIQRKYVNPSQSQPMEINSPIQCSLRQQNRQCLVGRRRQASSLRLRESASPKPHQKPPADTGPENQVTAFNVTTHDGEVLYAWHVLPLDVYEKHEADLSLGASGSPDGDLTQTKAFQLLKSDPKARLVINCKHHHPLIPHHQS